jgi:hypothetical protein
MSGSEMTDHGQAQPEGSSDVDRRRPCDPLDAADLVAAGLLGCSLPLLLVGVDAEASVSAGRGTAVGWPPAVRSAAAICRHVLSPGPHRRSGQ